MKLGDFNLSIKLNDNTSKPSLYPLKGVTIGYTNKNILSKWESGHASHSELI